MIFARTSLVCTILTIFPNLCSFAIVQMDFIIAHFKKAILAASVQGTSRSDCYVRTRRSTVSKTHGAQMHAWSKYAGQLDRPAKGHRQMDTPEAIHRCIGLMSSQAVTLPTAQENIVTIPAGNLMLKGCRSRQGCSRISSNTCASWTHAWRSR